MTSRTNLTNVKPDERHTNTASNNVFLTHNKKKDSITIPEILDAQFDLENALNIISVNSYRTKKDSLNIIKKSFLNDIPILQIEKNDIYSFLISITKYSNSVIEKVSMQLKLAFRLAKEENIIESNIFETSKIIIPKSIKENKIVHAFSYKDQKKLIYILNNDYHPKNNSNNYRIQILLSLFTGMRMGEINALTIDDIDFKNNIIHIRKTITRDYDYNAVLGKTTKTKTSTRDITMTDNVKELMHQAIKMKKRNKYGLIFYNYKNDSPISTQQVNSSFNRLCKKHGLKSYGQHMLRHTFATRCLEMGIPPRVLQDWMGHKNISITLNTYADVLSKLNNDSVNILNNSELYNI